MSTKKSEVVYRRPKPGFEKLDPEQWNDAAIVDAYDRAVKKLDSVVVLSDVESETKPIEKLQKRQDKSQKNVIWSKSPGVEIFSNPKSKNSCSNGNKKRKSKEDKTTVNGNSFHAGDSHQWEVGDECIALYYADGLYYACKIKSIDDKKGTCAVVYTGYGNEEKIKISDLHSPEEWNDRQNTTSETSETDFSGCTETSTKESCTSYTEEITSDLDESLPQTENPTSKRKKSKKHNPKQTPFASHFPPNIPPLNAFSMLPPPPCFNPHMFGGGTPYSSGNTNSAAAAKLRDLSDDALASMLMSWYMAGYHTGYYQGLNQASRKK